MQLETIGNYQVHLIAHELSESGKWDPFFSILKFDNAVDDFVCVFEKHHVEGEARPSYEAAIEAARQAANKVIETLPG